MEINHVPIGQIRIEMNDDDNNWRIDYSISKEFRGKGLGKMLLSELIRLMPDKKFIAFVKKDNFRSQRAFESTGFSNLGLFKIDNSEVFKYGWN